MRPIADAAWRKSSYSGNDNAQCLEVRDGLPGLVPVRDSKAPDGPRLSVRVGAWRAFVGMVRGAA
ncbi:DUF397 domain-containing protein [Streptomyces sp. YIM 98790]|uniref:DUF397 domain-containing protein n=1 Tax=Streptomyces sp. YIM 98790 TaxID=2689077 RepID=UPI00140CB763|nr:DUF397 domain-containing protein [Streptomyces sp. YIM 98790]